MVQFFRTLTRGITPTEFEAIIYSSRETPFPSDLGFRAWYMKNIPTAIGRPRQKKNTLKVSISFKAIYGAYRNFVLWGLLTETEFLKKSNFKHSVLKFRCFKWPFVCTSNLHIISNSHWNGALPDKIVPFSTFAKRFIFRKFFIKKPQNSLLLRVWTEPKMPIG